MAFRIGLFVVLALAAVCTGIFLIGSKDFLFTPTYTVKTDFPNVDGLNTGAEVRVGGIHEGTVKQILLPTSPDGKVIVVMNLRSSTRNTIKKDSVASIKTQGLMGDQYVEISFGSMKAADVQDGDTLASEMPKDLSKEANAIAATAEQGTTAFRDDMKALQQNFLLRGYFNKRGYTDTAELTQHAIPRLPPGPKAKEFDYDAAKIFGKASDAKLKDKKALNDAGKYLQENPFSLAVVTSSEVKGDKDEDRVLSEARAKVVRDYLVDNFKLDDTRLKTIGLGKIEGSDSDSSKISIDIFPGKPSTRTATNSSSGGTAKNSSN